MPAYYNPGNFFPATYQTPFSGVYQTIPQATPIPGQNMNNQYMINVDGEMSARAWQPQMPVGPNTIIPLWDLDGQHVYFRSTDAYGRMNPLRRGRIVFDDEQQLPQGQSGAPDQERNSKPSTVIDASQFATKQDFESLRNDVKAMLAQRNQNGRPNESSNRGENK